MRCTAAAGGYLVSAHLAGELRWAWTDRLPELSQLGELLEALRVRSGEASSGGRWWASRSRSRPDQRAERLRLRPVKGRPWLVDLEALDEHRKGVKNDPSAGQGG